MTFLKKILSVFQKAKLSTNDGKFFIDDNFQETVGYISKFEKANNIKSALDEIIDDEKLNFNALFSFSKNGNITAKYARVTPKGTKDDYFSKDYRLSICNAISNKSMNKWIELYNLNSKTPKDTEKFSQFFDDLCGQIEEEGYSIKLIREYFKSAKDFQGLSEFLSLFDFSNHTQNYYYKTNKTNPKNEDLRIYISVFNTLNDQLPSGSGFGYAQHYIPYGHSIFHFTEYLTKYQNYCYQEQVKDK